MADLSALTNATDAYNQAQESRKEEALKALVAGGTLREVASAAGVAVNTLTTWREKSGWEQFNRPAEQASE
jgi:uncharacterized protein YjcR